MKGSLHTDELMRVLMSSTTGLRTARRISHVFVMDVPTSCRMRSTSTSRSVSAHRAWQSCRPSNHYHQNPSTIEAAALCKMADRGQITGGILDGPGAVPGA